MTTFLRDTLDRIFGIERFVIRENERMLVLADGRFHDILGPGEHAITRRGRVIETLGHSLVRPEFVSSYDEALFRARPDVANAHLTELRTDANEVAVIHRDGKLHGVLKPEGRAVFWTDAGPWSVERFDVSEDLTVPARLLRAFARASQTERVYRITIQAEQAGLLFVDGVFERALAPGAHGFWNVGPKIDMKIVDLKRQALEISQQEVLTKDRVTIRVNLAVIYRVTDPVKAVASVKDFTEAMYREAQFAFRKSLGAKTLDEILAKKVEVDREAADRVRAAMDEIGVEVTEIALKDVILPGEMRAILNQVVAAEKEAEANVIRRREETNATRALLNTAKVMAENPVMLRLKELEALGEVAGKVERLVVHNGADGLMNDLVRLRE